MTTMNTLPHERENAWKLGGKVGERRGTKGPGDVRETGMHECVQASQLRRT